MYGIRATCSNGNILYYNNYYYWTKYIHNITIYKDLSSVSQVLVNLSRDYGISKSSNIEKLEIVYVENITKMIEISDTDSNLNNRQYVIKVIDDNYIAYYKDDNLRVTNISEAKIFNLDEAVITFLKISSEYQNKNNIKIVPIMFHTSVAIVDLHNTSFLKYFNQLYQQLTPQNKVE